MGLETPIHPWRGWSRRQHNPGLKTKSFINLTWSQGQSHSAPKLAHTPLSRACISEASTIHLVHALQGRDLSPTEAPSLLQSSTSKPGRMWAVHRQGLSAAMEGCTGYRPSLDRSSRHIQGSLATCLNRDSCCCRWHQFILPPCIALHLLSLPRSILREHPLGARVFQHCCLNSLPPSLPPFCGRFYYPFTTWSGAQAKPRVCSSTVCSTDILSTEPMTPGGEEAALHSPSSTD